jgi:hypothetical protein
MKQRETTSATTTATPTVVRADPELPLHHLGCLPTMSNGGGIT